MKEQLEQKGIAYMRGKAAGHDVRDDESNLIAVRGQPITDEVISKAREKGRLHHLMLSAAASVIQAGGEETRRRLQEFRNVTEGHEADLVRGELAGRDVTDFQGNVIVRQGEKITDEAIRRAQEKGLLQELVLAVAAPGLHTEAKKKAVETPATKMGYTPYPH